jgi:GxxExxY protein
MNDLSSKIIGAAIAVHKELGPGLLESVYQSCMCIELRRIGLLIESEVQVPVVYRGIEIQKDGFRIDLLVEDSIVVELKSVEKVLPVHKKQLLTYLKLSRHKLGLLINFNEEQLIKGITRISNGLQQDIFSTSSPLDQTENAYVSALENQSLVENTERTAKE